MVDAVTVKIFGNDEIFHFNNYALMTLGKVCDCDPFEAPQKIMEILADDMLLALGLMAYSGLIGYQKSIGNLKSDITLPKVLEFIGNADVDQLNGLNPAWESFKNSTQVGEIMEALQKEPQEADVEKKSL